MTIVHLNSPEQAAPPNLLRAMADSERPQERLARLGPASLSDTELLAMLLRSGTRGHDVITLATRLIQAAGSLHGLTRWVGADFRRMRGIGPVKALQLVTVMEVARRILFQGMGEAPELNDGAAVAAYMRPQLQGLTVEKCWVLCLNARMRLLRCVEITSGTANSTLCHAREVFRDAIREAASALILVHNHPSGDPMPSSADTALTRRLRQASEVLEIKLVDHVIVGSPEADPTGRGFFSFREMGLV
ncbi:JAB domain-containing protein [Opitutaceae bacterium TAV4]|uniref:RadC family protein n=1 Tax=Geminisphaera colitermitum TaxID=1148786 RepID=UPI000158CF45|nr:DNA repair protein RadC [Geminisphaera colitermitum]RRJ97928.1 JAB domain-containing protein [Opitutaceae bacterium TAV4]RRK02479.1 JAB domain-containing protein [Opitutaceae bacterium TAV3]